jgi:hypothetical protein
VHCFGVCRLQLVSLVIRWQGYHQRWQLKYVNREFCIVKYGMDFILIFYVCFSESGCYEVDPSMPVAAINADKANVNFKFYSSAECKGKVTYSGTTNGTVITVDEFSAGSVQVTCARQRRR